MILIENDLPVRTAVSTRVQYSSTKFSSTPTNGIKGRENLKNEHSSRQCLVMLTLVVCPLVCPLACPGDIIKI